MELTGDGAERKVKRLNVLARFIGDAAGRGRSRAQIYTFGERHVGLSESRITAYLRLLCRTGEIEEVKGRWFKKSEGG